MQIHLKINKIIYLVSTYKNMKNYSIAKESYQTVCTIYSFSKFLIFKIFEMI